jgi:hypothetical protein
MNRDKAILIVFLSREALFASISAEMTAKVGGKRDWREVDCVFRSNAQFPGMRSESAASEVNPGAACPHCA